MRFRIKNKAFTTILIVLFGFIFCNPAVFAALKSNPRNVLSTKLELKDIGIFNLKKITYNQTDTTQLILEKSGNIKIVVDSYEGLDPFELKKCDLDKDGITEIIAVLKYPDSQNVIPYVYTISDGLEKVFPENGHDTELLNCKEVFITYNNSIPTLCLKYSINFHEYAPPELYKLEKYSFLEGKPILSQLGYNEGTHYNLLMNLAAEFMHKGQTLEAASLYHEAIASSTGEMSEKAFCEALFHEAEALKFSSRYEEAMNLYEKIVLEYTNSDFTEIAQKEFEFLYNNKKEKEILDEFFKIQSEIINDNTSKAFLLLDKLINNNKKCNFMDRLLFTKAELLISENRVEEALVIYKNIKVYYPNSPLIETIDEMLEDLEAKPEDSDDGL